MKRRKKTILSIIILLGFGALIMMGIYQSQPKTKPQRKPASEYFEIVSAAIDPTVMDRFEANNTVWIIHAITFQIRAIGGDAHETIILSWANSEVYPIGTMPKGKVVTVPGGATLPGGLYSPVGYRTVEKDGKFPVTIRVQSLEAEGPITINLPPEGGFEPKK